MHACISYEVGSSQQLVSRGRPEPGTRVNNTSLGSTGPNTFFTKQSERGLTTRLADHPASIKQMILPLSKCDSCSFCLRKWHNGMTTSALALLTSQHTPTSFGYLFYTPRRMTLNALYRLYVQRNPAAFLIICISLRHVSSC
ncbi:hypothetical protein TNCV_1681361 [Trichonephila clavipes]|nr:hypothetical protein TNCV_1681361 [Trichonephila clavipes]